MATVTTAATAGIRIIMTKRIIHAVLMMRINQ